MDGWISVEDSLPGSDDQISKEVLCLGWDNDDDCENDGEECEDIFVGVRFLGKWYVNDIRENDYLDYHGKVSHWMPIPKVPA